MCRDRAQDLSSRANSSAPGSQAPIMPLWSPSRPQPMEYYACLKIVARVVLQRSTSPGVRGWLHILP
eukprot:scaffold11917_cov128-Isochrysis_galbana.AAC.5